jgi:hypothetical protein
MPIGEGGSHDYIYAFKNRLKEGSSRLGCILPLLIVGIFSLIGLLVNINRVNPILFVIPGISLLGVLLIIFSPRLRKKDKGTKKGS